MRIAPGRRRQPQPLVEPVVPERQRRLVVRVAAPRPVPDLDQPGVARHHLPEAPRTPRAARIARRQRMRDDEDLIRRVGRRGDARHAAVTWPNPPIDPLARAEAQRVAPESGQLDAAGREQLGRGRRVHFGQAGDRVVVGEEDEVEARSACCLDQLGHGARAGIGVVAVAVEVAAIPARAAVWQCGGAHHRRRRRNRRLGALADGDIQPVSHRLARHDHVSVDLHGPLAGGQRPGQVARRRRGRADAHLVARAASMPRAAKPVRVEDGQGQQILHAVRAIRLEAEVDVDLLAARGHCERVRNVPLAVARRQAVFKVIVH